MTNLTQWVDQKLIDAANAELKTAISKLAAATTALIPLQAHHDASEKMAEEAIASSDPDAFMLEDAAHLAARRLAVGIRIRDAAHAAFESAREGVKTATSIAWRGPLIVAVQQRLDASKAADAARKALALAEASYEAAAAEIANSISKGAEDFLFGAWRNHSLVDHQTEWKRWSENYHINWFNVDMLTA